MFTVLWVKRAAPGRLPPGRSSARSRQRARTQGRPYRREALSRFPSLLDGNLARFEIEARRAFTSLPDASILVADLNGQELMNTAAESGLPLASD
jgi:hypothetical protein